jgi:DNA-binding MarR family transcriptional regulator
MYNRPVGTVYLLKRTELAVRSCMEVVLLQFDLTPAQMLMLFRLRDHAELSSAALAREIGVQPQSMISLIRPLERRGILKRERSPTHGRIRHMRFTPAGRKLLADALRVAAKVEAELLQDLNDRQVELLQDALTKLWGRAEEHDMHPDSIRTKARELMRAHLALKKRRGVNRARG